jgi:hypothetical protein
MINIPDLNQRVEVTAHHAYRIWFPRLEQLKHFNTELETKPWCNVIYGHQTEVAIAFLTLLECRVLGYVHIHKVLCSSLKFWRKEMPPFSGLKSRPRKKSTRSKKRNE